MAAVGPKAYYITEQGWFWSKQRLVSEADFKAHQMKGQSGFSLQGIVKTLATGILAATQSVRMGDRASSLGQQVALLSLGQLASQIPTACAQLLVPSDPFQVNTITTGDQINSDIAEDPTTGNFMIVWADSTATNPTGISGQIVDPTGKKVGTQIQISDPLVVPRYGPFVAALKNVGRFAVVWTNLIPMNGSTGNEYNVVVGKLFNSTDGLPVGTFQVDKTPGYDQSQGQLQPLVAPTEDGFFVGWISQHYMDFNYPFTQYDNRLYGQQFNSMGMPTDSAFPIDTIDNPVNNLLGIASPVGSSSFVIWGTNSGVYGQGISQTGPLGSAVTILTREIGSGGTQTAAPVQGGFAFVFENTNVTAASYELSGQLFNELGAPLGAAFNIDSRPLNQRPFSYLGIDGLKGAGGGFIVTWSGTEDASDGSMYQYGTLPNGALGQQFNAQGAAIGDRIQIGGFLPNNTNAQIGLPAVAATETGGIMATYQAPGASGLDIYARLYIPGTLPPGVTVPGGNPGGATTTMSQTGSNKSQTGSGAITTTSTTQGIKKTTMPSSGTKINMSGRYLTGALLAFQVAKQVMNRLVPAR